MISDERLAFIAAHGRESIFLVTPDDCSAMAKELLALRQEREGWKLVPVEPTTGMYEAGDQQLATKQVWDAMLAASPTPHD